MEATELITKLGLDPATIKTVDDFHTAVDETFIRRDAAEKDPDIVGKVTGKTLGAIQVNYLRELKGLGVELAPDEIKDKKVSDIQKLGLQKLHDLHSNEKEELKKTAGKGNDEKVVELENKYKAFEKKYNDLDSLHKTTLTEFSTFKEQKESQEKAGKVGAHMDKSYGSIKWSATLKDTEHEGLKAIMNKNFIVDLDDKGEEIFTDKQGNRIKSTKTTGAFKTYAEQLEEEADKRGMIQKNNTRTGPGAFQSARTDNNKPVIERATPFIERPRVMNPPLESKR